MGTESRRIRDQRLLVACVATSALLLPCVAIADQVSDSALSLSYLDPMHTGSRTQSLRLGPAQTTDRLVAPAAQNADALSPITWSGAHLIELPRNDAPGTYSRPRYALGFRSEPMKSFLNEFGVDAATCLAPLVRARSKLSSSGQVGGTLWLSARCDLR
jgi:hypothetical protein